MAEPPSAAAPQPSAADVRVRLIVAVYLVPAGRLAGLAGGQERLRRRHSPTSAPSSRTPTSSTPSTLSVKVAIIAVVINTVFGVGISILLVRYEFPGKRALSALIDLPLSVSPIVVGLALILVYDGRDGWFGPALEDAGIQVIFATPGIVMATVFVALPLVIREVVPVLAGGRHRAGAGGPEPRGQRAADLPAHHPADDQVGRRLRRRAEPGPLARRVRRREGRLRQRPRRDPHRPRSSSRRSTSTSTRPAPTRPPSCWRWSRSPASSSSLSSDPRSSER